MTSLLLRLPTVRGRYTEKAPLSKYTWFGVGGPAEVLFKPEDVTDLIAFLKQIPEDIPVFVLGVGSNILVRDGGIDGVVIKLGRAFATVHATDGIITAGAAALDQNVAQVAYENALGGLEFLSGIPGTIGGACRMNAGAYGSEIKDILIDLDVVDRSGNIKTIKSAEMGYSYRHSTAPDDWIIVRARLKGVPRSQQYIAAAMNHIRQAREESQPIKGKTGGSTFTNPPHHKAWQLIDESGCRGLTVGKAQMSEKHCNFMINTGGATAEELEQLGETVRQRVFNKTNVDLHWEIVRLGKPLKMPDNHS